MRIKYNLRGKIIKSFRHGQNFWQKIINLLQNCKVEFAK